MKTAKKTLGILLSCLMLMSLLSMGVCAAAAGTQENPIDASTKWFGYGVDTYLLNPTIAADSDGIWYTLTAEQEGILFLEHSYKNVDYTIYIRLNGIEYEGGCVNGEPYNRPIVTAPIAVGDVATIQIVTKDAAAGTVYASMQVISGDVDNAIKVKSDGLSVVVGAGQTVYFQDDSLNAIYATKGLLVAGDVADTTFYTVTKNTESGAIIKKAVVDSDNDGKIEAKLGGSLGSAGAPPVKPAWAIENNSDEDQWYTMTIANTAHECVYDDDADADCNSCGAIREIISTCQHEYLYSCDATCAICGEFTNPDAAHRMTFVPAVAATCTANGNIAYYTCEYCGGCWDNENAVGIPLNRMMTILWAAHSYTDEMDAVCNTCGDVRFIEYPVLPFAGNSISEDVNGLAFRFDVTQATLTLQANTIYAVDYSNCTVNPDSMNNYKLVMMGAVLSNNEETPTLECVNNRSVLNVPAAEVQGINEGTPFYVIRITNIPRVHYDTPISCIPYYIYENAEGEQTVVYGDEQVATYNAALETMN